MSAAVEWVGCAEGNWSRQQATKIGVMPHWIVGSLDSCIKTFQTVGRYASTQYGTSPTRKVQFVSDYETSYHCGNSYYNGALISIEQEGWPGHPPVEATLQNTAEIMATLSKAYGFGKYELGENVFLHSWVAATACPGETDVPLLIAKANALLEPAPPRQVRTYLYHSNASDAQRWALDLQSDGSYIIRSKARPDMVLDVRGGGSIKSNTQVWGYVKNYSDAQKWLINEIGDNGLSRVVELIPFSNKNLRLDISGGGSNDKALTVVYKANNTPAQRFSLVPDTRDDGYYYIVHTGSGKVVDLEGAGKTLAS